MTNRRDEFAGHLTFSRRYGYEPLPEPMRLEEISDDLKREIFNAIRVLFLGITNLSGKYFVDDEARFIERVFGRIFGQTEDKIGNRLDDVMEWTTRIVFKFAFNRILDFLEIIMNDDHDTMHFSDRIQGLFERHGAAYRLDTSQHPYQFFPRATKEQGDATQEAIETLRDGNMDGAATHLRQAAEHINAQQYADSIADSIHAVESVARVIDPKANETLGPALNSLERAGLLKHPALKKALNGLYTYTNKEQGIRHALTDQSAADVGLDEAMFMFGACASFAAYLANKHRQVGRQKGTK